MVRKCVRLRFIPINILRSISTNKFLAIAARSEPSWSNKLTKLYNTFNDIIISEFIISAHFSVLLSQFVVHCFAVKITVVALHQSNSFNSYDLLEIRKKWFTPECQSIDEISIRTFVGIWPIKSQHFGLAFKLVWR